MEHAHTLLTVVLSGALAGCNLGWEADTPSDAGAHQRTDSSVTVGPDPTEDASAPNPDRDASTPGSVRDGGAQGEDGGARDASASDEDGGGLPPECALSDHALCAQSSERCATLELEACEPVRQVSCPPAPDPVQAVFVSAAGSDSLPTGTCGSPTLPCRTLTRGLEVARLNQRSHVYLSAGTFEGDGVALWPGLTIEGGWSEVGGLWTPLCEADAAEKTIVKPSASSVTVRAEALEGSARLRLLTLRSRDAGPQPGESFYGLVATGANTQVELDQVIVDVRAGGAGATGARGANATGTESTCTDGMGGSGSAGGAPAQDGPMGSFAAAGYVPAAGLPGLRGGSGQGGVAGADGSCVDACASYCATVGGACQSSATWKECAGKGRGGCGGLGGEGGAGGAGGGSSVALFAWDATVRVRASTLRAGDGGAGGKGGEGGAGAAGAAGGVGESKTCTVCANRSGSCSLFSVPIQGGFAGMVGGTGGVGGVGAGGAGGHSHAAYRGGSAVLDMADTELVHGAPGAGGAGSRTGVMGAAGQVGPPEG